MIHQSLKMMRMTLNLELRKVKMKVNFIQATDNHVKAKIKENLKGKS